MRMNTQDHNVKNIREEAKKSSKERISNANEYFARWNYEISELVSNNCRTPEGERRLAQLERLLSWEEKYECFFPVHKMPIYQEIMDGTFMSSAQGNKKFTILKQQLKESESTMNQQYNISPLKKAMNAIKQANSHGSIIHIVSTTIIGGICMIGAVMLLL